MDCCNAIKTTPTIEALPIGVRSERGFASTGFSRKATFQSQNLVKAFIGSGSLLRISARRRRQPLIVAVANAEFRGCRFNGLGTPLEPISPEGKFLSRILQNQRHLFHFAVSEQLDELASDRDGAMARKDQSSGSIESLLHRRIAEIKESECQIAVEDIMYMSIVHKFSEVEVPMVQKLSKCMSGNRLEIWPSKCKELESIHNVEVQEMIREHLDIILRMRTDGVTTTTIDRLHLGRIYAASIMYGYFLKSACFRRQMDLSLVQTQEDLQPVGRTTYLPSGSISNSLAALVQSLDAQLTSSCDTRRENLRSYVTGFDSETLQRCAKLKSQEAVNVIERHTWALFGHESVKLESDDEIVITFPSLERLVLEAVAFGSFLWDVERSVDSAYGLKEN